MSLSDEYCNQMMELFSDKLYCNEATMDAIASTIFETYEGVRKDKQAFFIMGPPGAGKSSTIAERLIKTHKAVLVDSDIVKEYLPFYGRGEGAPLVNETSGTISFILFGLCLAVGANLVYPFVGADLESILKRINLAHAYGYTVHLFYVHVPLAVSLSRIYSRWKDSGRFVSFNYALTLGNTPLENYKAIINTHGDKLSSYLFYDNDIPQPCALNPHQVSEF